VTETLGNSERTNATCCTWNSPWLQCWLGAAWPGSSAAEKDLRVVVSSDLGTSHSLPGSQEGQQRPRLGQQRPRQQIEQTCSALTSPAR